MATLTVDREFGYVVLTLFCTFLLNIYLGVQVGMARKKYNVPYPAAYANAEEHGKENAFVFNCVQRGHQNTLESLASFQLILLFNGLFFPMVTSAMGMIFIIGRFLYARGYAADGPKGRSTGGLISHLADIPLMLLTAYNGVTILTAP